MSRSDLGLNQALTDGVEPVVVGDFVAVAVGVPDEDAAAAQGEDVPAGAPDLEILGPRSVCTSHLGTW